MIENKHFCKTKKKFCRTLSILSAKYPEILQPIMNLSQKLSRYPKTFRLALLTSWRVFSDSGLVYLYLYLHLFIVVFFANKTPLGEPDGQVAATICLPCPALSPLYLSSVFTSRYCFPCIYNPCALKDIVSPVFIICVMYNISKYCPPCNSKPHNIHCQLRSSELIQSFKISSNTRREPSPPGGQTFSPPTNKELWRPWWRVRELIFVFVFISSLFPFFGRVLCIRCFDKLFSWHNLVLHIQLWKENHVWKKTVPRKRKK